METATAKLPEQKYKYRGKVVSIIGESGGLRNVIFDADEESTAFWVKANKLKLVKAKKVHQYDIPNLSGDPFVAWLLTQKLVIRGECPTHIFHRLVGAYSQATGKDLESGAIYLQVSDIDKSWGYSLYVAFPVPPVGTPIPYPSYNHARHKKLEISNNELVLGLLALGLEFGVNQPCKQPENPV